MSIALLFSAALVVGAPRPLVIFHGDPRAPAAWVAAADTQLWVCWDGPLSPASQPRPSCWQRLPLEMAPLGLGARLTLDASDAASFRLGFVDPETLALVDELGQAWSIQRDGLPIAADEGLADGVQGALTPRSCSASGWLPRRAADRVWSWERAPCQSLEACPIRPPTIRRRPLPIDATLAIEIQYLDDRTLRALGLAGAGGAQLLVGVSLGLAPRRAQLARQELRRLASLTRSIDEGVPIGRARPPLAADEALALRRARCRAWEVSR